MSKSGQGGLRIQLVVDSPGNAPFTFERWMADITLAIQELNGAVAELRRQAGEVRSEIAALRAMNDDTKQQMLSLLRGSDDLQVRMNGLDERLDSVLAMVNSRFDVDSQTEQGMLHHEYAKQYLSLVEQKAVAIARDIYTTPFDKAGFIAALCRDLFETTEVREQDLMHRLPYGVPSQTVHRAREICADARSLRDKIAGSRDQRWDFSFARGAEVDATWQEIWPGSELDGVIDFVVAPAYVVDHGARLTKQRVFTAQPAAEPTGAARASAENGPEA